MRTYRKVTWKNRTMAQIGATTCLS